MPYNNMPKSTWSRMEKCVNDVKKSDPGINQYSVCYSSIMNKLKKAKSSMK